MNRRLFARALAAGAVAALALCQSAALLAQQPIRIRVSNQLPPSSAMSKGLELWKDRVEKGTQGRVKVELYPSSQLYKDNEVVPAVQKKSIVGRELSRDHKSGFD